MALVLRYVTGTQLAAAWKERYAAARGPEKARLASWLLAHIDDGTWTDNQVRNVFNLSVAEYTTYKNKLIALRDHWVVVMAATEGE